MAANLPDNLVPVTLKCVVPYTVVCRQKSVERQSTKEVVVYVPQDQVAILKKGANRVVEKRDDHIRIYHNVVVTEVDD